MAKEKLKICICSTFYPPYSFEVDGLYVKRLARGLAKLGHEVTVVHNFKAYQVLSGEVSTEICEQNIDIKIEPLNTPLGILGLLSVHQTGSTFGLKTRLQQIFNKPFDVIHYYNSSLLGGPSLFKWGKATIKIGGLSDHWLICPMHILWNWKNEICTQPQCIRCCLHQKKPPQLWRYTNLMTKMVKHIDAFLGPSRFTIDKHLERGFEASMIHLPLFYKPSEKSDKPKSIQSNKPYFLCVGRLEEFKGFQEVIPLFRKLQSHSLLICGNGSYYSQLKSLAAGLSNVQFLQETTDEQISYLYENAVATIIPSLSYQTFSHVAAESFSAGTPIIAKSHSSIQEIISTHGGGILYTDIEGLLEGINECIDNVALRKRLGSQAVQTYSKEYSEDVYMDRYIKLIRYMIDQKLMHGKVNNDDLVDFGKRGFSDVQV